MTKEENEQKMKEKYVEVKYLEEKIGSLQQQLQVVEQQSEELHMTNISLHEFEKLRKGDEILIPLSTGIFAKASLKESSDVLINVGADVVVKQHVSGARDIIKKQIVELQELQQKIIIQLQKLISRIKSAEQELKALAEEA